MPFHCGRIELSTRPILLHHKGIRHPGTLNTLKSPVDPGSGLGYNTPQEILDLHNNPQEAA